MLVTLTVTLAVPVTGPAPPLMFAVMPVSGVMAMLHSSVLSVTPS